MDRWKLNPDAHLGKAEHERWKSVQREPGLAEALTTLSWQLFIGFYLRCCHRFEIEGKEHIPPQLPYILIANHSSHLDALCLMAAVPKRHTSDLFAIAAQDTFFTNLGRSWFAAYALNALPLSRSGGGKGREEMELMRARLMQGNCGFILFPEGTRSRDGNIASFRSGLGMLVAGTNLPVVPIAIDGAFTALPPQRKFPRFSRLRLRIGEPCDFSLIENSASGWKEVAIIAEQAVRNLKPKP